MLTNYTGGSSPILAVSALALLGSFAFLSQPSSTGSPRQPQVTIPGSFTQPPAAARGLGALAEAPGPEILHLRRELDATLREAGSPGASWGVLAVSLDLGDTLLAYHPEEPLTPASNMKLLTSAAALHFLGPDFRFRTFLLAKGRVDQGVLYGDLLLYGSGDPSLSERFFPSESGPLKALALDLVEKGITRVEGNLVVDGSYFSGPELHPDWDPADFNEAFAPPVAALSLAENLVTLRVVPGSWVGAPAAIHTMPQGSGLQVRNTARTESPGTPPRIWLERAGPSHPIGIEGEIPSGGREVWRQVPVPDPLLFAGRQMERTLVENGVRIMGGVRVIRNAERSPVSSTQPPVTEKGELHRILAAHTSPPLLDLLRIMNKQSNNLLAESVLKTLGRVVLGDGSYSGGADAVRKYLSTVVGIPARSVTVRDGSGLSSRNRVAPGAMVEILLHLSESPSWEEFVSTLPEAGVRRELGRMYRSAAAGNLWAKTGTMEGVSALSGLVRTRSGERILFSVLSNGVASERRAKRAEDRIGIALSSLNRRSLPPPNQANSGDRTAPGRT